VWQDLHGNGRRRERQPAARAKRGDGGAAYTEWRRWRIQIGACQTVVFIPATQHYDSHRHARPMGGQRQVTQTPIGGPHSMDFSWFEKKDQKQMLVREK
jgi:hypothetical protein